MFSNLSVPVLQVTFSKQRLLPPHATSCRNFPALQPSIAAAFCSTSPVTTSTSQRNMPTCKHEKGPARALQKVSNLRRRSRGRWKRVGLPTPKSPHRDLASFAHQSDAPARPPRDQSCLQGHGWMCRAKGRSKVEGNWRRELH